MRPHHLRSSALLGVAAGAVLWACWPAPAGSQPGGGAAQAVAAHPAAQPVAAKGAAPANPQAAKGESLRSVGSFNTIKNKRERSVALFNEASRVLMHARCVNCHPPDDSPRQGDQHFIHSPPVSRGPKDRGVVAMECSSCHQDRNLEHARVPGAPEWHLAPLEQVWLGRTAGQICNQIKDKRRNGGKTLEEMHEHMAHDKLVAWGWNPGHGRTPAPGTQEELGALIRAWIDTGAECPPEEVKR